jgi:EmrB/QacA subfamily drug resistance transporter
VSTVTETAPSTAPSGTGTGGGLAGLDRGLVALGVVVVLGAIMPILDATIVSVATRVIGEGFHASLTSIQWVLTGYLLGFAAVIPATGWAAQRFGAKRVFIAALALFLVASALAGSAAAVGELIAFRVLQGIGGGMILPVGQLIIARAAGPERMGRVMSMLGVPMLLGSVAGPVIGGLIVSSASWRWIFFINPPVGLLTIALAARLLPSDAARPGDRLDLRGLLLLCGGVASITYGMSGAGPQGGFGGGLTLSLLAAGTAMLALYAVHALAHRDRAPIDISLLRYRGFAASVLTNLIIAIALFGALLLLPLYWQIVRGASPLATGLLLAPQALGAAVALPLAGKVTDRAGAAVVVPTGIVLGLAGIAAYTQAGAATPYAVLAGALFVLGLGLGATFVPLMAAAYQGLPRTAIPAVTSTLNTVQRLGASIGTALLAVILQGTIARQAPSLRGGAVFGPLPPGARAQLAPALAGAFGAAFWVAFALAAAALIPALLLPHKQPASQPATGRTPPATGRTPPGTGPAMEGM